MTTPPETTSPDPVTTPITPRSIFESVQNFVGLVVALGAFLSASGFVIVHVHLAYYSPVQPLQIPTQRYASASFGLLLLILLSMLLWSVVGVYIPTRQRQEGEKRRPKWVDFLFGIPFAPTSKPHPDRPPFNWIAVMYGIIVPAAFGGFLIGAERFTFFGGVLLITGLSGSLLAIATSLTAIAERLTMINIAEQLAKNSLAILFFIGYTLLLGFIYGNYVYRYVPYQFGGGAPFSAQIYLQPELPNWSHPNTGIAACVLMETHNGILIYQAQLDRAVFIPYNENTLSGYSAGYTDQQTDPDPCALLSSEQRVTLPTATPESPE